MYVYDKLEREVFLPNDYLIIIHSRETFHCTINMFYFSVFLCRTFTCNVEFPQFFLNLQTTWTAWRSTTTRFCWTWLTGGPQTRPSSLCPITSLIWMTHISGVSNRSALWHHTSHDQWEPSRVPTGVLRFRQLWTFNKMRWWVPSHSAITRDFGLNPPHCYFSETA